MNRSNLLTGLAVAVITISGTTAYAQTWDGSASSAWDTDANWVGDAAPTTGATVTIPDVTLLPNPPIFNDNGDNSFARLNLSASGASLSFAAGSVMILTGDGGGVALNVAAGATMTISGTDSKLEFNGSSDSAVVSGTVSVGTGSKISVQAAMDDFAITSSGLIQLSGTSPEILIEAATDFAIANGGLIQLGGTNAKISADAVTVFDTTNGGEIELGAGSVLIAGVFVELTGAGAVEMVSGPVLQINANAVLVNDLGGGIFGAGSIAGVAGMGGADNGAFVNLTEVAATTGVLTLAENTVLFDDDLTVGEWIANGGDLFFKRQHTSPPLEGAFLLTGNGKLIFDASVTTNGIFTCTAGDVEVNNGSTFTFSGGSIGSPGSSCP